MVHKMRNVLKDGVEKGAEAVRGDRGGGEGIRKVHRINEYLH